MHRAPCSPVLRRMTYARTVLVPPLAFCFYSYIIEHTITDRKGKGRKGKKWIWLAVSSRTKHGGTGGWWWMYSSTRMSYNHTVDTHTILRFYCLLLLSSSSWSLGAGSSWFVISTTYERGGRGGNKRKSHLEKKRKQKHKKSRERQSGRNLFIRLS